MNKDRCSDCKDSDKEVFGCKKLNIRFSNGYMASGVAKMCDDISDKVLNHLRMQYGTLDDDTESPYMRMKRKAFEAI